MNADGDVLLTEAEWRAALTGARALRELGAHQRDGGAHSLAAESVRDADVLEGLVHRAVIETERATPQEVAYAMYEALTDPVDAAEREDEARLTGRMDPSDDVLREEFRAVCAELGLPATHDLEAER